MADTDMEPNCHLFSLPRCVPPRLVVNQNEQDDNSEDIDERDLPLFLLKKMSDDAFMQVISTMPLRKGGTFIANYACRRLNRILATTARLVPVAYDPFQPPRPWYILAKRLYSNGDIGVPWAYDPISNRWYKFPLPLMRSRDQQNCIMWHKIASADGLVCVTRYSQVLDYATYELELFDPYTQRFRTLPKFERKTLDPSTQSYIAQPADEGYTLTGTFRLNFSVSIWMINPATCEYKVILTRCMTSIAENSNHVFVDSYDQTHMRWKTILRTACGMPPGWEMQGGTAICNDILYSIFYKTSLVLAQRETAVGYQLFLHQFDLKSRQYFSDLHPMPEVFCFPGAAVLLNCNNNLILVGTTREDLIATSVKVWKFNPHPAPGWLRLGVMPDPLLLVVRAPSRYGNLDRYSSGGGNFIYFRNDVGQRVVVLDLSMTDEDGLRLRVDAWKEAPECPDILRSGAGGSREFCYEPRLLMGVPI
ncbi:hypothetical protein O6H91_04G113300 [Diphasiastrum complanatum]|uniref:Uncharacterized protein n=1 Tax=Diphasiastrum complanatum TaxID=34168 RepID=A0ACC2E126_DIPCM|nr:hypothetical protein O6H91_04G113300 [Diphasiastrum complanatum]